MHWSFRKQTQGTSHSCYSGFREDECSAATSKTTLLQRVLTKDTNVWLWPAFLSISVQLKTQVNICVLHLNISALCFECICAYHILDNVQPSYLSNDYHPALQLTHHLPPWPGKHPNVSGLHSHCKQKAVPGNAESSICEKSSSILYSPLRLGVMLTNQMASFRFFRRANGTHQWFNETHLHIRHYTQNLSQVRIRLHIITIYKK